MDKKVFEFLLDRHPYDQISQKSRDLIFEKAQLQRYEEGQSIYQIGEKATGLFIVRAGKVEINDALGDLISILGEGNSFGERGLLNENSEIITQARALSDCELFFLPADVFYHLKESETSFAQFFDRQARARRRATSSQDIAAASVSHVMSSPVLSVPSDCSLRDAAQIMHEKGISALAVMDGDALSGIFTLRDMVYKSVAVDKPPSCVAEIMTSPVIALPSSALVIDAMVEMARNNIGHLLVLENGKVEGIVTKSNLVMRGANSIMGVLLEISRASSAEAMKPSVARLPELLAQMAGAGVDGHIVMRLLTDIADAVTKRLIEIYEEERGVAPVPFLWAACGSQGRQEQTGVSDQDNCIIYSEEVEDKSWFEGLAKFVSDGLDLVGYFYCPGDMMASNPMWCQPVSVWREYFRSWVKSPTEEAQMLASVMFDLRAIEGDASLLEGLQEEVLKEASENSIFLAFLISNSLKHQPPLSLFRGVATIREGEHKNTVDLKHSGVVPIADLARVYAIQARTRKVNTRARLHDAMMAGVISEAGSNDLIAAYDFIQEIRLRHQSRQIRAGEKPDNFLSPTLLSDLERSHLRDAFVVVKSMQSALSRQANP